MIFSLMEKQRVCLGMETILHQFGIGGVKGELVPRIETLG